MKPFRSLLAIAAVVTLSIASYACDCIVRARVWLSDRFDGLLCHVANVFREVQLQAPRVKFTRARAFVARMVKRQAPRIEASWRMCPST